MSRILRERGTFSPLCSKLKKKGDFMKKRFKQRTKKIVVSVLILAMMFSFMPINYNVASAETVPNYDVEKAVNYAKAHYDDGGTALEPDREDCTQFVRECFEAGGVPKDENRVGYDDRIPYGYTVDDYISYMVDNGYAEVYPLKTEKQDWSNPQWYVRAEDNKDVLSVGDGILYYCTECKTNYHMSINTGVDEKGFVLYHAQNSSVGGEPLCLIGCSHCGASKEKVELSSIHITSIENNYATEFNNKAVSGLKARRVGDNKISISWDKVDGASGYKLFVKAGKNQAFSLVTDTKETSCIYTEKNAGANYYFAVRPYFEKDGKTYVGKLSSDAHNNEYLLPPAGVTATLDAGTGKVNVKWQSVPGASSYEVYRATSVDGTYSKVFSLEGTSYISEMLYPDSSYYYKVKAINKNNSAGNSDFSDAVKVTTGKLTAPVVKTEITDKGIAISWDKVVYANSYHVTRAKEPNGKYWDMGTISGNKMNNSGLTPGQVYYYKVEALNTNKPGSSAVSEVVAQIAKLAQPSAKTTNDSAGKPVVSWGKVNGADSYEVYRATSTNGTYSKVQTTSAVSYTDTSAVKGKTYYYKVKAVSKLDENAASESNTVSAVCKAESAAVERFAGNNRYATAMAVADSLKKAQGVDKFDSVIVAYGDNYADALAGSYLAKVKNAPILVVNEYAESSVKDYINKNVKNNGNVYLLGGEGVVSKRFENSLTGYNVKRLGGSDRFATNLNILKEAGVKSEDVLVCSAFSFADSLSASAVGKPILLVDSGLTSAQKAYLSGLSSQNYYLIGGTGAVTETVRSEVGKYGKVARVSGANRYATSKAIADKFFPNGSSGIVIASGDDFPDGLTGGPLAMAKSAPLFLVNSGNANYAKDYVSKNEAGLVTVVGGQGVVPDKVVNGIIG